MYNLISIKVRQIKIRSALMNKDKVIYTCLEHIEMALDDYVNEIEVAPAMEKCEDKSCDYCKNNAAYKLSK